MERLRVRAAHGGVVDQQLASQFQRGEVTRSIFAPPDGVDAVVDVDTPPVVAAFACLYRSRTTTVRMGRSRSFPMVRAWLLNIESRGVLMDYSPIGILGTGSYVPAGIRTNNEVAAKVGVTAEWIADRTGVRSRHVADPGQAASDLAAEAVRNALEGAGLTSDALGLLVLATSTPDELGPSTACRVQALLGAERAVALDVSAACTGWLFATRVARADTGERYAAVVGVECYSRFINETDRATASLFADGAAATVLGLVEYGCGFAPIMLGSDGRQAGDVLIPAGGSRLSASADTVSAGRHLIHMDGRALREFILDIFPKAAADALKRSDLGPDDVALVVSHQPNLVLVRRACAEAGLNVDRLVVVGDRIGNIGAGGLPYSLAFAHRQGRIRHGDRVLVVGFGAGLTWGSTVLTWDGAAGNGDLPLQGRDYDAVG